MARPYSADLRARVLLAHEHGEGGATALARRFRIGLSTLHRWLDGLRDAGRRAALPPKHLPRCPTRACPNATDGPPRPLSLPQRTPNPSHRSRD